MEPSVVGPGAAKEHEQRSCRSAGESRSSRALWRADPAADRRLEKLAQRASRGDDQAFATRSTHPDTVLRASSSLEGSLSPACARSGRPPPPPPTTLATSWISLAA